MAENCYLMAGNSYLMADNCYLTVDNRLATSDNRLATIATRAFDGLLLKGERPNRVGRVRRAGTVPVLPTVLRGDLAHIAVRVIHGGKQFSTIKRSVFRLSGNCFPHRGKQQHAHCGTCI
jgi:hypothetical protein